jgi:photosystem II stability/assembly factor-like uncharacterized protein
MKKSILILFLLFTAVLTHAQRADVEQLRMSGADYHSICRYTDSVYSDQRSVVVNHERGTFNDGSYIQYQRWKWYWHTRVDENGRFPDFTYEPQRVQNPVQSTQSAWTNISQTVCDGGYNGMGRATCIAFDPVNPQIMYVGAPIGGLWKTTDGGLTYAPLTDALPYVSVGSCVVDYTDGNTLYISVGDHQGWWNFSRGIYKSTDGGATWNATGLSWQLSQGRAISKIEMDPFNNQILYAATSNGLYKTINGGTNWTIVHSGYHSDIEFEPGTSNIYAALHDYWGSSEVFRSTDGGATWTTLTNFAANYNWIRIAVTPANPAMLAVMCSINNRPLYLSYNYGATLNYVSDCPEGSVLFISPANAAVIYCGGVYVQKSTDSGVTWNAVTWWYNNPPYPTVHADQRNMAMHPLHPDTLYFCNDGGLYSYAETADNWTELTNGFLTTQFYKISHSQTDPMMILGGTQDNGGRVRLSNGTWRATNGGDAMEVAIDQGNNNIIYTTYIYGELYRSMDRWVNDTYYCISDNIPGGTPNGSWVAPYMIDPSDNQTLVAGYDDVWRTTDRGASWTQLSTNLFNGSTMECLTVAASDPNVIWVSADTGLKMTPDLGNTWITLNNPSNKIITSITINPNNTNEVWLTFGEYSANGKVYYSNNGGLTWSNWSTGLPNVAINCSVYENGSDDRIYIGTDAGVYTRDSLTATWTLVGTGMPNTAVTDLEIMYSAGKLRAGTYGRGIWETDISLTTVATVQSGAVLQSTVVPNPSVGQSALVIHSQNQDLITAEIYNAIGELVWTSQQTPNGETTRLELPELPSGSYIVRVMQGELLSTERFIVR